MKNKLVQWRGGGYDGCIWEPNTGFFDQDGEWNPVISTGYRGRATLEQFKNGQTLNESEDLIFDITKEGLLEFQTFIRDDFFVRTLCALEEAGYDVHWKCNVCGRIIGSTENFGGYDSYRGDGGIGIVREGLICEECKESGTCPSCKDYVGSDMLDANYGICDMCFRDLVSERPDLQDLADGINAMRIQRDRLIELKPELKHRYRADYEKCVAEDADKINKLVREYEGRGL